MWLDNWHKGMLDVVDQRPFLVRTRVNTHRSSLKIGRSQRNPEAPSCVASGRAEILVDGHGCVCVVRQECFCVVRQIGADVWPDEGNLHAGPVKEASGLKLVSDIDGHTVQDLEAFK